MFYMILIFSFKTTDCDKIVGSYFGKGSQNCQKSPWLTIFSMSSMEIRVKNSKNHIGMYIKTSSFNLAQIYILAVFGLKFEKYIYSIRTQNIIQISLKNAKELNARRLCRRSIFKLKKIIMAVGSKWEDCGGCHLNY